MQKSLTSVTCICYGSNLSLVYIFTACHLGKLKLAFTSPNVILTILRDPGADSGGEGKSKQAGKYGTKEN